MRWLLSGPTLLTWWISFATVFSFMYWWVLIFALSPFYILIYMFWEMIHGYVRGLSCKPNIYVPWSTSKLRVRLRPWNWFKPFSILLSVPRQYFFCGSFALFMPCACHAFASVHCCLLIVWWERGLPLGSCLWFSIVFCHFPIWYPGSGVVLDCIDSRSLRLSYFNT